MGDGVEGRLYGKEKKMGGEEERTWWHLIMSVSIISLIHILALFGCDCK